MEQSFEASGLLPDGFVLLSFWAGFRRHCSICIATDVDRIIFNFSFAVFYTILDETIDS